MFNEFIPPTPETFSACKIISILRPTRFQLLVLAKRVDETHKGYVGKPQNYGGTKQPAGMKKIPSM